MASVPKQGTWQTGVPQFRTEEIEIDLTTQLGNGCFGSVFPAIWVTLSKKVVVKKLMKPSNERHLIRFKKEAALSIGFTHHNIVRNYGCVPVGENIGIVMEYADRGALSKAIAEKTLDLKQKYKVGVGVTDGLIYLHNRQVVHRDIKTDNILLFGTQPIAKISDFGISNR
jgi:protein-serine/threonine kinase